MSNFPPEHGDHPALKLATSESDYDYHVRELEGSSAYYIREHTPEVLQHLNASKWIDRLELQSRNDLNKSAISPDETVYMEGSQVGTALSVVKTCVDGRPITFKAKMVCEGVLVRAVVGASNMEHVYGYTEGWLCVASRMLHYRHWKRVWALLTPLYNYMAAVRAGHTSGSLTPLKGGERKEWVERGKKLFTALCGAVDAARSHLARGAYVLRDEDITWGGIVDLRSGKNVTTPTDYGRGVLTKLRSMYETEEARAFFPLENGEDVDEDGRGDG